MPETRSGSDAQRQRQYGPCGRCGYAIEPNDRGEWVHRWPAISQTHPFSMHDAYQKDTKPR